MRLPVLEQFHSHLLCWGDEEQGEDDIFWLSVPTEAKFSSFWNLILDEKKPLFTTEKFLYQANDESKDNIVFALRVFRLKTLNSDLFFAVSSSPHASDAL